MYRYNTKIQSFPTNVLASDMFSFSEASTSRPTTSPRTDPGQLLTVAAAVPQAGAAMHDEVTANKRRSRVLVAGFFLFALVAASILTLLIGALLGVPVVVAVVVAVLVALGVTVAAYRQAGAVALRMSGATPAPGRGLRPVPQHRRGSVHRLGAAQAPAVRDRPTPMPSPPGGTLAAALAVTSGLLERLNRIELEVVAHELSHVRSYDVLVSTLAVTMVGVALLGVPPLVDPVMQWVVGGRRGRWPTCRGSR